MKDLIEAAEMGLRHVEYEIIKIANNNARASDEAWARIHKEPVWKNLKAQVKRFKAAIRAAKRDK